jgi:hypothetical protein
MIESVVTCKTNGELIAYIAPLYIKPQDFIFDMTFGRGLWWTKYQHPWGIKRLPNSDFRHLDIIKTATVDVVTLDPPFISPGGRKTSTVQDFNARYGLEDVPRTPALTDQLIADGLKEAARIAKPKGIILAKSTNYITSGQFHPGVLNTQLSAAAAGLVQVDEFIHRSGTGPQPKTNPDGSLRRQVHGRSCHSVLSVFQKPGRKR